MQPAAILKLKFPLVLLAADYLFWPIKACSLLGVLFQNASALPLVECVLLDGGPADALAFQRSSKLQVTVIILLLLFVRESARVLPGYSASFFENVTRRASSLLRRVSLVSY